MTDKNDDIDLLILDYLNGLADTTQEEELERWLGASEQNRAYFARTIALLETTASLGSQKAFSSREAWKRLNRQIDPSSVRRNLMTEAGKFAAVFVLAFFIAYLFFSQRGQISTKEDHQYVVTEVPYGSKSVVSLPDGSRVWINAGSKMIYSTDFNKNSRDVELEGEAFFDIVTDKSRPFFVKSGEIRVKATGTQFNVRAYPDEEFVETTLVEGEVSIGKATAEDKKEIVLRPNQKLTIYKKETGSAFPRGMKKRPSEPQSDLHGTTAIRKIELESDVSTPVYTSWKDREWVIYREKLGTLARKLERRYDVRIFFSDDSLEDLSYTGTLQDENLKEVLDVMSLTSPICYKFEDKTVRICYNPSFNESSVNE